jgi:putative hydrolase of the HAD superfamily
MTRTRAVFFDVGGTLLHLDRDFILACLAERGLHHDHAAFKRAERLGRAAMMARLQSTDPGTDADRWRAYAQALLDDLGCRGDDAAAVRARIIERNQEGRLWGYSEPGTADTLARLKQDGYIVGIVSNSNGRVHEFLQHANLSQYLDFVVDSGTVGVEKPDPRIFEIACTRAGVSPCEALHVGDLYEIDIVGARNAGITPVLIDHGDATNAVDCHRIHAIPEIMHLLQQAPLP